MCGCLSDNKDTKAPKPKAVVKKSFSKKVYFKDKVKGLLKPIPKK